MSQSAISRIWRAFALAPHRTQTEEVNLMEGPHSSELAVAVKNRQGRIFS
jgi:hypothetical protein